MAKGMEKKRRLYWNEMAKNLCIKTQKSKQDISRLIDEAWRKEQTGLLLKEKKLIQAAEALHGTSNAAKSKPSTIEKNVQRIQNSQREIDRLNTSIEEAQKHNYGAGNLKRKHELQELQRAKKFYLSDLKKAQDVMRKNLKCKMSTVKDITKC